MVTKTRLNKQYAHIWQSKNGVPVYEITIKKNFHGFFVVYYN